MKSKLKIFYSLIAILLFTFSCKNENNKTSIKFKKECVELNNKGMRFYLNKEVDSTIFYLEKSIECDPNYTRGKTNLITILAENKKYHRASKLSKEVYEITKSPFDLIRYASFEEILEKENFKTLYEKAFIELKAIEKENPEDLNILVLIIPLEVKLEKIDTREATEKINNFRKKYINKNEFHKNRILDSLIKDLLINNK